MNDLKTYEFGFIGVGNMGGALAAAVCKKIPSNEVLLSDKNEECARTKSELLHCDFGTNEHVAASCKFIFLGVKPQMMKAALAEIAPTLSSRTDDFILVTMAAGIDCASISAWALNESYPVIRIMPNTPASVGKGMILYCTNGKVCEPDIARFTEVMSAAGRLDCLDETLIDAGSAVSGCGPAFVYMFIEALADGGVKCGLPRAKALEYAAATVCGAAELVLHSGKHPGELKDAVCSPAGTTIEGVKSLEESGFRGAAMDAVIAAFERTKELGKK